jgi:CheY-like chemotaxis protein
MSNILWIDDDIYHIKSLLRLLEKAGHQLITIDTLPEASDLISSYGSKYFDLIVLDLLMNPNDKFGNIPDWLQQSVRFDATGIMLLKRMRDLLKVTCPVIILSIVGDPIKEYQLEKYGPVSFVHKSGLRPSSLCETVTEVLSSQKTYK